MTLNVVCCDARDGIGGITPRAPDRAFPLSRLVKKRAVLRFPIRPRCRRALWAGTIGPIRVLSGSGRSPQIRPH